MRKVSDLPANRVACYEWKAVNENGRTGSRPAALACICVSAPGQQPPRAIALYDGENFLSIESRKIIPGVTYWCHCPATPEDIDQEEAAAKKSQPPEEPDLFKK